MKKSYIILATILLSSQVALAYADAPVVNDSSQYVTAIAQPLTGAQAMAKLQQQVTNIQNMNLGQRLTNMQQEIQSLRGQLEVQAHQIALLTGNKQAASQMSTQLPAKTSMNAVKAIVTAIPNTIPATMATVTTAKPTQAESAGDFLQDQQTYENAYQFISQKDYVKAINAMEAYLQKFPSGKYVVNAHYWLGELYLLQNNSNSAMTQFAAVTKNFPNSQKYPDAMLKLGFIYYDNGQLQKAKTQLTQVTKLFPGTTVAQLAQARLQDVNQQLQAQPASKVQTTNSGAANTATTTNQPNS